MGFLRRIFSGRGIDGDDETTAGVDDDGEDGLVEPDAEERQHELDVLRAEAERLDELTKRQLKYADHAWEPPAQGSERRADDDNGSSRP
ncbi:MAG TPA: hypothetical protein VFO05_09260 [Candidatus Limnocylindrales bacterium]|nr:hypothetical protein [Candidatus Limnocylindrales bacterium]